ncbi:hypothetical protein HDU84_002541 [Entophlyctis sp. JEL0112]|nr:hypothetical protein HDU84_002541 [Entophlyctis sp. JEL0112]
MDDSSLKFLRLSTRKNDIITIMPPFDRKIKEYSAVVGSDVDSVMVKAQPNEGDAFVQIQKSSADGWVTVAEGTTDVAIKCDAADGTSSNTVIHVFRPSPSDATLKSIQFPGLIQHSLIPDFHRLETKYVLTVPPNLQSLAISALTTNSAAKMEFIGFADRSSGKVLLSLGETVVGFEVVSADGKVKQTYTVIIRKDKVVSRLEPVGDVKIDDICSVCNNVVSLPRRKGPVNTCGHVFCLQCLTLFAKSTEALPSAIQCPLCLDKESTFSDDTDETKEKSLLQLKSTCPFASFGCTVALTEIHKIPTHIVECSFAPPLPALGDLPMCGSCQAVAFLPHTQPCVYTCAECQKIVPEIHRTIHTQHFCVLRRDTLPAGGDPAFETSAWESQLVDRKSCPATPDACVSAAETLLEEYLVSVAEARRSCAQSLGRSFVSPKTASLEKMATLYATAISLNAEAKKLKGVALDESLHFRLGLLEEELAICKELFPDEVKNEKSAKANDNEAANNSFMSDEVDGLLMGLGVAKNASDATKIKAMEEEYHRLAAAGLPDQAAEVQGLHQWKVQQVNGASGKSFANTAADGTVSKNDKLSCSAEKFEHAVKINTSSSEAYYSLGRLELMSRKFESAQIHLELAASIKPTFSGGWPTFLWPELISHAVKILSTTITNFQILLWLDFKSAASSKTPLKPGRLAEEFQRPSHAIFALAHLALSKGHLLLGEPAKAGAAILDGLSTIPKAMAITPKRSMAYKRLALAICELRGQWLLLCCRAKSEMVFEEANKATITSTLQMMTSFFGDADASLLSPLESIGQLIVFSFPGDIRAMALLGERQLAQVDGNPMFLRDLDKLNQSIECFEAAVAMTAGGNNEVLSKVQKQKWYLRTQTELDGLQAIANKLKEVKSGAAQPKAGAKKSTAAAGAPAKKEAPKPAPKPAKAAPPAVKSTEKKTAPNAPKSQAKDMATKKGSNPKLADKQPSSTKGSKSSLADKQNTATEKESVPKKLSVEIFDAVLGLARAYSRKIGFIEEKNNKDPSIAPTLQCSIENYKQAITIKPSEHDPYIELGALLERKDSIQKAIDIYSSFPFPSLDKSVLSQDDLYLFTELGRCLMKEKRQVFAMFSRLIRQ